MDLRDFIKETISAIVDATSDLQVKYEPENVIINPPVMLKSRDLFDEGGAYQTFRRVEIVEFDVAVSAASETAGGGKAAVKIMSAEVGADGRHNRKNEEASRVRFSIPVTLRPSSAEGKNRTKQGEHEGKASSEMPQSSSNSWMGR